MRRTPAKAGRRRRASMLTSGSVGLYGAPGNGPKPVMMMVAVGRSIAAILMAKQIRQAGQIHPETVLTEIGALAGFATQMSIRKAVIEPQGLDPNALLAEIVTKNDEKYYFSDLLNWMLFENLDAPPYSICAYLRDVVPEESRALVPDVAEIVGHAAQTIGTARFGVPRLPPEHMPHTAPRPAFDPHWRAVQA